MESDKKLTFVHIPKTGGIAIKRHIQYLRLGKLVLHDRKDYKDFLNELSDEESEKNSKYTEKTEQNTKNASLN